MRTFRSGVLIGFLAAVVGLIGCATAFPYRYYAEHFQSRAIVQADVGKDLADLVYQEGILWGKSGSGGWPDVPLNDCKPDPDPTPGTPSPVPSPIKLKCITMFDGDFYSLKADDEKCHSDLDACQHPKPSP